MKTSIATLGALATAALSISLTAPAAHACERQFGDSYYLITPLEDDAMPYALNATCAMGTVSAYTEQTGWVDMLDENGEQLVAMDIMGVAVEGVDFLVALGPEQQLVFRWGDFAGGEFFVPETTFRAIDLDGNQAVVLRLDDVSYIDGELRVDVRFNSHLHCAISADSEFIFDWQTWECYDL